MFCKWTYWHARRNIILYWKTLNRYFPTTNCKLKKKNFQPVLKPTLNTASILFIYFFFFYFFFSKRHCSINTASILKRDTSKSRDQDCRLQTNSKPKNTGQETKVLGNPLWRENEIDSRVLKMSWYLHGCTVVFSFVIPHNLNSETFSFQKEAMAVILSWCVFVRVLQQSLTYEERRAS